MYYLKHPQHGNRHVASREEANELQRSGWTLWPRPRSQKFAAKVEASPSVATVEIPAQVSIQKPAEQPYRKPQLSLGKRK